MTEKIEDLKIQQMVNDQISSINYSIFYNSITNSISLERGR